MSIGKPGSQGNSRRCVKAYRQAGMQWHSSLQGDHAQPHTHNSQTRNTNVSPPHCCHCRDCDFVADDFQAYPTWWLAQTTPSKRTTH